MYRMIQKRLPIATIACAVATMVGAYVPGLVQASEAPNLGEPPFTTEPLPTTPGDASTVAYYESNFHLPPSEAQRRVNLQNHTQNLASAMSAAEGSRYAGIWFDNSDGRLKIGVTPGANIKSVEGTLATQNVSGETDIVTVPYSWAELVAEQTSLDHDFHALEEAGQMRTGIDTATNAVDIMVPDNLAASNSSAIHIASRASSVKVDVQVSPAGAFPAKPTQTACGIKWNANYGTNVIDCAKPLRGGVEIEGSSAACTAGFYAIDNASQHVIFITAGHCFSGGNYWYANYWDGHPEDNPVRKEIGPMEKPYWGVLGDAMEIDAMSNGCGSEINWWCYAGWPPEYMSTITKLYDNPVNSVNVSQVGYVLCETGAFGASKCGTVQHTHVTENYGGHEVQNMSEINICLHDGDSGGPVYSGSVAYGINNASTSSAPCEEWYTEALNVENLLNVAII